jgi:peptide chain release factor subunit 1
MLTDLKNIDIKELSEVHDPENRSSFISLYLSVERADRRFIERRKNTCISVLKESKELSENLEGTMKVVEDYLDENSREKGQKGFAIFASNTHDFFRAYKLGIPIEDMLIVDSSPYILPLARLIDEYKTFGLVLLDSHRAKIYVVCSGWICYETDKAKDIMNKHKRGGMSQARFQRLRTGAINQFLKDVSEDMEKLFSEVDIAEIIIAGPGNTKTIFEDFLPVNLKSKIADIIDMDFNDDEGILVSKAMGLVMEDNREKNELDVSRLKDEILKNGLAVYGLKETKEAARNGQLGLLLVGKGHKINGWACESCQAVGAGIESKCSCCGGKTSEVDVIEEIVKLAERTGAKIEFIEDNSLLDSLGGIGGLLRFKRDKPLYDGTNEDEVLV